ncbi:MAG TPA: hypothetical protein VMM57_00350 [Bacteroidota bacterium]|nr:hypothetical protein [Bacteroidota bacterium]
MDTSEVTSKITDNPRNSQHQKKLITQLSTFAQTPNAENKQRRNEVTTISKRYPRIINKRALLSVLANYNAAKRRLQEETLQKIFRRRKIILERQTNRRRLGGRIFRGAGLECCPLLSYFDILRTGRFTTAIFD